MWNWRGAEHGGGDLFGGLGAHIEDLGAGFWQGGIALTEKAADHARVTGSDTQGGIGSEGLQTGIAMGGHFAEIGDGFEAGAGFTEFFQHAVLYGLWHYLSVGAAAVEKMGGR